MRLSKTHVDGGFGRTKTGLRFWRKLFHHPILYIQQTRTLYTQYYASYIIHSTDTHTIHAILYILYHTFNRQAHCTCNIIQQILYIQRTHTLYMRYCTFDRHAHYTSDIIHSTDTHTIHAILYIRYYTFNRHTH